MWLREPLTTDRLRLRAFAERDRAALVRLRSDERVRRFLGGAISPADAEADVAGQPMGATWGVFAVADQQTDRVMGSVHLSRDRGELEVSWLFLPENWGSGFAQEAVTAVIAWAFEQGEDGHLIAITQSANIASCRLADRLGMTRETTFEEYGAEQSRYVLTLEAAGFSPGRIADQRVRRPPFAHPRGVMSYSIAADVELPEPSADEVWVVGALIVNPAGELFVQRRSFDRHLFPGCWDVVGGHVEPGESLLDALARELEEETGWTLRHVAAVVKTFVWHTPEGDPRHEVDLLVEVEGDLTAPALEWDKHPEYRWIGPDDVPLLAEHRREGDLLMQDATARAFALLGRSPSLEIRQDRRP